jgi:hypothetical protein
MNFGMFSGYAGHHRIIGTQFVSIDGLGGFGTNAAIVAPPEATHALISAQGLRQTPNSTLIYEPDQYAYNISGGPPCCYRIPFILTPRQRYIPVVSNGSTRLWVGSDGESSGFADLNSTYGPKMQTMSCVRFVSSTRSTNGGEITWIHRASNQTSKTITLAGGTYNSGGTGGDGRVITLEDGGVLASGSGPGGGGQDDTVGGITSGEKGGNVPSPWGTMQGGRPNEEVPGEGATLFEHGRTFLTSAGSLYAWNIPGDHTSPANYISGWVFCEFISTQEAL